MDTVGLDGAGGLGSASAPSLREDNKARTRQALHDAALTLCATQGYDNTTVDQIAAKARVSKRTFFRYFPSKEAAVFWAQRLWVQDLADTFARQPASLGEIDALAATFTDLARRRPKRGPLLYVAAVASSPNLRRRSPENLREELGKLADAIADRRGLQAADENCVLLAHVAWTADRRAHERWSEMGTDTDLGAVMADEFVRLVGLFTGQLP